MISHPENYSMVRQKNGHVVLTAYSRVTEDTKVEDDVNVTESRQHGGKFYCSYDKVRVVCLQPLESGNYTAVIEHPNDVLEIVQLDKDKAYSGSGKKYPPFKLNAFVAMYLGQWQKGGVLTNDPFGEILTCLLAAKRYDGTALALKDDLPVAVARVLPK